VAVRKADYPTNTSAGGERITSDRGAEIDGAVEQDSIDRIRLKSSS
jgi:hypothetical protein